jgi:hypothetical protein
MTCSLKYLHLIALVFQYIHFTWLAKVTELISQHYFVLFWCLWSCTFPWFHVHFGRLLEKCEIQVSLCLWQWNDWIIIYSLWSMWEGCHFKVQLWIRQQRQLLLLPRLPNGNISPITSRSCWISLLTMWKINSHWANVCSDFLHKKENFN